MIYGYCVEDENELKEFDRSIADIYIENTTDRTVIKQLISRVVPGDIVVCKSIRDLGQNINAVISVLYYLMKKEVEIICIQEDYINIKDSKELIQELYKYEFEVRQARQKAGYERALQDGRVGRPRSTGIEEAIRLYDSRRLTAGEICRLTEISQSTLYRAVRDRREKIKKDKNS